LRHVNILRRLALLLGTTLPFVAVAQALPVIMTMDAGLPTHTVYRPTDLTSRPGHWPVVVWANGECLNLGNRARSFLSQIAAQGYVVIAVGPIGAPVVERKAKLEPAEGGRGPDRQSASHWTQLIDALNWAEQANATPGNAYFSRLDVKHIAVMGQSCGGMQALSAAADPRVTTLVEFNSGTLPAGSAPLDGTGATQASLAQVHGAVALVTGDEHDVASRNADADFALLTTVPVVRAVARGIGHEGSFLEPQGGVFTPFAIAWLNWQLKGDTQAARAFSGKDCGLCRDAGWSLRTKRLP
jgi:hypothetical protein